MVDRRQFLVGVSALTAAASKAASQNVPRVRQIDIIHHTHTDIGYTDNPSVVRDRQKRYTETIIDLCASDKTFRWTIESLILLDDWWKTAAPARRAELLRLIRAGQVDVMGMALNQTPFMNALQWRKMMSWIPADLWRSVNPRAAMQNDVNGLPRAGAIGLLDHGIRHLLMGINSDSGGPPFQRPSAFWWKMPDGRRMFVWLGETYGAASTYLGARQSGLNLDEKSVRAANEACLQRLRTIESQGYQYDRLILTFGSDNRPPSALLAPFVQAWNRLELQPVLRLTTASSAVMEMEKLVGSRIPTMEGEFTDWWANGDASSPREVAASRSAKRSLAAAMSAAWGPMPADAAPAVDGILRDLCLFDEHTWGASSSISQPYGIRALGQWVEKSELAFRPAGMADWLLARRARTRLDALPEGVYVANTAPVEVSGWAALGGLGLRGVDARSLVDQASGARIELRREGESPAGGSPPPPGSQPPAPGAQPQAPRQPVQARFWVERLAPNSIRSFRLDTTAATDPPAASNAVVKLDSNGWPVTASWPGMRMPLFDRSLADFICVGLIPPADRRTITGLHANPDPEKRAAIRKQSLRQSEASYGETRSTQTPHTVAYVQEFRHPRLDRGRRSVELWKTEPRARVSVRFNRLSSEDPELFYLAFALPEGTPLPAFSSGGVPFTPYRDQLPGSCRDYFGIDGWAHYSTSNGHWLWVTRDAPLAVVGGPHALERHQAEPADRHRILAMIFDNCWHTNFVADSHGLMEFQFDLVWREKIEKPAELAEAVMTDPVVIINSAVRESPAAMKNLWRP